MTRTKRLLVGAFIAAAVAVGTASPALADQHVTDVVTDAHVTTTI